MAFGDRVTPARELEAARWIDSARSTDRGTVGALVPNVYESYLLVEAAPAASEDWWRDQRSVVDAIARAAARHTTTPHRAWFAIWEGHGWDTDELVAIPRISLPQRNYYLLTGEVADVTAITEPGRPGQWQRSDLWWPDDRSWFVATDVDFWCNYVGGTSELTTAVADAVPTPTHLVELSEPLVPED